MFARLFSASVWARGAVPAHERDDQLDARFFLPLFDVGIIILGIFGAMNHIPALDQHYPEPLVDALAYSLSLAGALALVGVSFPRLERLELCAKFFLIAALAVYPAVLLLTAAGGDNQRWVAGIGLALLVLIPFRRVVRLIVRIWRHRVGYPATEELTTIDADA